MNEKYNGWANYPTWNVKLWIDNDESSYNYWLEQSQESYNNAVSDGRFTKKENASFDLAKQLQDEFENPIDYGTFSDLLSWALGMVDWNEIADSLLEEIEEDESQEDEE